MTKTLHHDFDTKKNPTNILPKIVFEIDRWIEFIVSLIILNQFHGAGKNKYNMYWF